MLSTDDFKKYFWYIFGLIGVVFFWVGVYDGPGYLPYVENPLVSIILGIALLSLSGVIFKGANPLWEAEKPIKSVAKKIHHHPQKHEFHFKYKSPLSNKEFTLEGKQLKSIEKEFLVFLDRGKEFFVPLHRVTEVLHQGKTHWKA